MMATILYPGTFDPITHGHVNLVQRATGLFDEVILAIAASAGKSPTFSLSERVALAREVFADYPQVQIDTYSGLLVEFMRQKGTRLILRGIRALTDMDYEFQLANMNQCLDPTIETLFLKSDERFTHVSSTIVREIASMGGNLSPFVPEPVVAAYQKLYNK